MTKKICLVSASATIPLLVAFVFAAPRTQTPSPRNANRVIAKVKPLHKPLGKPQPGDWLASHKEPGQTFAQYLRAKPITPTGRRRVIYIQPLGEFTESQRKVVTLAAEFLSLYYNRPVKIKKDLPLSIIPKRAQRKHPTWGMHQILSIYVINDVLPPRLPDDAAAYIAFTASDLWPGEGWNFVFGQASLRQRVGVWSIYRNGDPAKGEEEFRLCLRRTLKTATHETGHMFSIRHCTAYECNMCGSNNRAESDRQPLHMCPQCLAKVLWATGADPIKRYQRLAVFCELHGLKEESEFYSKSIEAVR